MTYELYPDKDVMQQPFGNAFIMFTVLIALFLNSLPWQGVLLALRPDFVALVMLYWCTHNPARVGISLAWLVGILADVADASLLGQHALSYSLLAFGGVALHRRLQMFNLREQTSQVLGIFALTYGVYALVHWQVNGYVAWPYLLGCVTSTLLWAPLSIMLRAMRQMRVTRKRS